MFAFIHDKSPTPGLADLIARQHKSGGRLIAYRRMWAFVLVVVYQDRIELVPLDQNRHLAGWRHAVFTLLLGSWSFLSVIALPIVLLQIFRGGVESLLI